VDTEDNEVDKSSVTVLDNVKDNSGQPFTEELKLDKVETNEVFNILTYCQVSRVSPFIT